MEGIYWEPLGLSPEFLLLKALVGIGRPSPETLTRALDDDNPYARAIACWGLGILGDAGAVVPLIRASDDGDPGVRAQAIDALVKINDPRADRILIAGLKDADEKVGRASAEALRKIKDVRLKELLLPVLDDSDPTVRMWAAWALGELKDPRATEPLVAAALESRLPEGGILTLGSTGDRRAVEALVHLLERKDRPSLRRAAATALGKLGDPVATEPLARALRDFDPYGIAKSLAKSESPEAYRILVEAVKDTDHVVRVEARNGLWKAGDPMVAEALVATLKGADSEIIMESLGLLASVGGSRAVESLRIFLKHPDSRVRLGVVVALGRLDEARATSALGDAIRDSSKEVRYKAAVFLARRGETGAVDVLLTAARDAGQEGMIRGDALGALGTFKDERAVDTLIAALGDGDWRIRGVAMSTLAARGESRFLEFLLAALKSPDTNDRVSAAQCLGHISDPRAVEPLIKALRDKEGRVRVSAAAALGELKDSRAVQPLAEILKEHDPTGSYHVWRTAVDALGAIGDPKAIPALALALRHKAAAPAGSPNPVVRALERIDSGWAARRETREAVPALIDALGDPDQFIRNSVVQVLGMIGDPRALKAMCDKLGDEDDKVGEEVAFVLGGIGGPEVFAALMRALNADDSGVRAMAASSLGEMRERRAIAPLFLAMAGGEDRVRHEAFLSLVKIDPQWAGSAEAKRAVPRIIDAHKGSRSIGRRIGALQALAEVDDDRIPPVLVEALADGEWWVRQHAVAAMIGRNHSVPLQAVRTALWDNSYLVHRTAVRVLARRPDPEALDVLIEYLEKGTPWKRTILDDLKGRRDIRLVEPLRNASKSADPSFRELAAGLLAEQRDPPGIDLQATALGDRSFRVRYRAARALGEMGDRSAVEHLERAVKDEDWLVRQTAAESLRRLLADDGSGPR